MAELVVEQPNLRDKLKQAFAKAKMPTNPGVATRILALAKDPNSTFEHFADVIRMDAALAARIIKMANAAHYGQSSGVTTIPRAVAILGMSQVRAAALGFQLVGHLNKLGGCPFDMKAYWQQSVLRACLMRIVARRVTPKLEEEAFLVGLLQDCGVLLLVQLLGAPYADFCKNARLSPTAFYLEEKSRFPHNHVEACTTIAEEWKLPKAMIVPISSHHTAIELDSLSTQVDRLCGVSYLVGSMRFTCDVTFDASEPELAQYAEKNLGLSSDVLTECLRETVQAYAHMAEMMGGLVPEDADVTELLSEANRQLTEAASDAAQRVDSAEAEREQVLQQQSQLKSALGEYRERAARDPLTGISNRGALADRAMEIIAGAADNGSTVTMFFLDIDNFKKLNDRYSHATGDAVLVAVAKAIASCTINGGCVGRYGGEEFVLCIAGLSESQALAHAERVVAIVRSIDYKALGLEAPVTCSLGAVWGQASEAPPAEQLMHQADELMYEAKRAGKDRARFNSIQAIPNSSQVSSAVTPEPSNPSHGAETGVESNQPADIDLAMKVVNGGSQSKKARMLEERKHPRKDLGFACKAFCLSGDPPRTISMVGRVRNMSAGGLSLLVARTLNRGDAVEVQLNLPDNPTRFLGGIVAFCRHVEGKVHEIGVQLVAHTHEPIFSGDPVGAISRYDWVATSLRHC